MEVEIVAKEVIKPSSSATTKTFNLSFLDQQINCCVYSKLFFFYENSSGVVSEDIFHERARDLKSSLSEVLTRFYPLTGKIKDGLLVFTDEDDGVEFLKARINHTLSEYLAESNNPLFLTQLVPDDLWESCARPLLSIQASSFNCGGLAIGMNISHRVTDAASFTSFVNAWASTTSTKFNEIIGPDFNGSLLFPPSGKMSGLEGWSVFTPTIVRRRFVFSLTHITDLQEKATEPGLPPPSRVLTISSFLWRIGMKMLLTRAGGSQMPSTLSMPINLRRVLPPPISDRTFGNLWEFVTVRNHNGDREMKNLVTLVKQKVEQLCKAYQDRALQGEKDFTGCFGSMVELEPKQETCSNFTISSWCKFPLYEADFGGGKPTWVASQIYFPNCMILMDTSDGIGIEVLVSFAKKDMDVFASDEELLAYATPMVH